MISQLNQTSFVNYKRFTEMIQLKRMIHKSDIATSLIIVIFCKWVIYFYK